MINLSKQNIKKILVIRNDHIGDLVLSSCVFRELKKSFPNAKITAVASSLNKSLLERSPYIDQILIVERTKKFLKKIWQYPVIWKKIHNEKFDVGIDLRGDLINAFFLMFLTRVKYKIGFENKFSRYFLDYTRNIDYNRHESKLTLDLINGGLGIRTKNNLPEIFTSKEDEIKLHKFVQDNKLKEYICIVPETPDLRKQWPLENFDEIIKHIRKKYPKQKIVLLGSNQKKIDWLISKNPGLIKAINLDLKLVYLLLKKSNLVISLDVGPMHLAWAANAPLIAIILRFNSINVENIRPLSKNAQILLEEDGKIEINRVKDKIKNILG